MTASRSPGKRTRPPLPATVALGTLMATAVGVSSAYLGGVYDIVVQRVVDASGWAR